MVNSLRSAHPAEALRGLDAARVRYLDSLLILFLLVPMACTWVGGECRKVVPKSLFVRFFCRSLGAKIMKNWDSGRPKRENASPKGAREGTEGPQEVPRLPE